jgi:hypothetical protein
MKRALTLAAAGLALSVGTAHAGSVGNAPWCAVLNMGTGDVEWDCEYPSVEACAPNVVAGNRGFCNPNPAFVPRAAAAAPRHHRKRR